MRIMKLLLLVFFYLVVKVSGDDDSGWSLVGNPLVAAHPCNGSTDIQVTYEPGRAPEEENQYNLYIHKKFPKYTKIKLRFDKGATVALSNESFARIDLDQNDDHTFTIRFFKSHEGIFLYVQGCALGVIPYVKSVNINTKEYCTESKIGFLDSYIEGYKKQARSSCAKLNELQKGKCGRVQTHILELSGNGAARRSDWPWHVAVFKKKMSSHPRQYFCGGTLISNYHVLTAAHCTFDKQTLIPPEKLSLYLGKYHLYEDVDLGAEEKEIEKIIVHEHFTFTSYDNDIALLKTKSEVTFNLYIQPACLWYETAHERLISEIIVGTIVGWGLDDNNTFSSALNQAEIPIIPTKNCLQHHGIEYAFLLNDKKFCAGLLNEAIACTGDSGGGFHVFIPDKANDTSLGTWHVRGIVSLGISSKDQLCSGNHYTIFTDVYKHKEWILNHMS